jgi:hypothetical protein
MNYTTALYDYWSRNTLFIRLCDHDMPLPQVAEERETVQELNTWLSITDEKRMIVDKATSYALAIGASSSAMKKPSHLSDRAQCSAALFLTLHLPSAPLHSRDEGGSQLMMTEVRICTPIY